MRTMFQAKERWPKVRYSHMHGTLQNTNATETHADALVASDSTPATAPPTTPPTSNKIDRLPAACTACQIVKSV